MPTSPLNMQQYDVEKPGMELWQPQDFISYQYRSISWVHRVHDAVHLYNVPYFYFIPVKNEVDVENHARVPQQHQDG